MPNDAILATLTAMEDHLTHALGLADQANETLIAARFQEAYWTVIMRREEIARRR